jgi:hypothetical protein
LKRLDPRLRGDDNIAPLAGFYESINFGLASPLGGFTTERFMKIPDDA